MQRWVYLGIAFPSPFLFFIFIIPPSVKFAHLIIMYISGYTFFHIWCHDCPPPTTPSLIAVMYYK